MNISGYQTQGKLGRGGMAVVYLATQQSLDRSVALKVLKPAFADSPEFSTRFLNEGRIVASLNHPNIITIHDIGIEGRLHYISMEYVDGRDLKTRVSEGVTVEQAFEYAQTICEALAYAHSRNIVHRDIKPRNILFRSDGSLVLSDFGIAKRLDGGDGMTAPGTTLGSPHYVSPEQARGYEVDARADVYSVGVILYEMLTGRKPYVGKTDVDTIIQLCTAPLPPMAGDVARFQPLVERMMAKDARDRFANAEEALEAIRSYSTRTPQAILSGPTPAPVLDSDAEDTATELNLPTIEKLLASVEPRPRVGSRLPKALGLATAAGVGMFVSAVLLDGLRNDEAVPVAVSAPAETVAAPAEPVAAPTPQSVAVFAAHRSRLNAPASGSDAPLVADESSPQRVEELLARAETAMADLRLTTPQGDSAFDYFSEVLAIDPGNETAIQGIDQLSVVYSDLALGAAAKGKYEEAVAYLLRGLEVDPDNKRLVMLTRATSAERLGARTLGEYFAATRGGPREARPLPGISRNALEPLLSEAAAPGFAPTYVGIERFSENADPGALKVLVEERNVAFRRRPVFQDPEERRPVNRYSDANAPVSVD